MTAGLVLALGGVGLGILPRTVSAFVPAMTMGLVGLVDQWELNFPKCPREGRSDLTRAHIMDVPASLDVRLFFCFLLVASWCTEMPRASDVRT